MLEITAKAREKIDFYMQGRDSKGWGIRVRSQGGGFAFSLEEFRSSSPSDQVIEEDGTRIIVDKVTASRLEGGKIDFVEAEGTSGFKVEARPVAERPTPKGPDFSNPDVRKVHELLINEINPAIASHGGTARLIDVRDNHVYLQFGGGCHGCGQVDVTLKEGIERRIKEVMPTIQGVIDVTDHATGANPYIR